jgi:HSP20 family protein
MYRRYRTPSAWREMDRLQREMNRLFSSYAPSRLRSAPGYPALNIWENEDGQMVSAEMPGVQIEDIDITVEGDTLTISGERSSDGLPEGAQYHRRERGAGEFLRSIRLPYAVDLENIQASFADGILTVSLPRAEAEKPKKISIKI